MCDDPNVGAESGRAPALIGVETALAVADWPTLLLPALMAVASSSATLDALYYLAGDYLECKFSKPLHLVHGNYRRSIIRTPSEHTE